MKYLSILCTSQSKNIPVVQILQSSVYFVNTSLSLSLETRVKYLFPVFSSMYPSAILIIRIYSMKVFTVSYNIKEFTL